MVETPDSTAPDAMGYLDDLPDVIYRCRHDAQWTMLSVSREIFRLTGYRPLDFIEKKVCYTDIMHAGDREKVRARVDAALHQRNSFEVMYRIIDANGCVKWVWERGCKTAAAQTGGDCILVGIISDITGRKKRIEETLTASEERYRDLQDNIPIGLYRAAMDGFFLSANPAMREMFGYSSREAFLNTPLADLYVNPRDRDAFLTALRREGQLTEHELYLKKKSGDPFWASVSAVKVTDAQGDGFFYDGYVQDITARKIAETTLRESEERYRILTENITDGVALIDDGKLQFANHAFKTLFGYKPGDTIDGTAILNFVIESERPAFEKKLQDLMDGVSMTDDFEIPCRTQDRRRIWIEASTNRIKWQGRSLILAAVRDITKKKQKAIDLESEREYLRQENIRLRSTTRHRYRLSDIIGKSDAMQTVYDLILQTASNDANVIVYGESGTGKELTARAIHQMSRRSDKAFVVVNCGAIPENLIESEFFGYKKGAFTGAVTDKAGYLNVADGGTLFLDEVGEIPLSMQVKLLRVIDGGGMSPLGGTETLYPDIRIIAATNKNLKDRVRDGAMREDFFYRMHIIPITLPPLRDREGDLPLLVEYFSKQFESQTENPPAMTPAIIQRLSAYHWPGNVRELKNVIQRYMAMHTLDIPEIYTAGDTLPNESDVLHNDLKKLPDMVREFEIHCIGKALEKTKWHRGKAAALLGIDRKTLTRKLNRQ